MMSSVIYERTDPVKNTVLISLRISSKKDKELANMLWNAPHVGPEAIREVLRKSLMRGELAETIRILSGQG